MKKADAGAAGNTARSRGSRSSSGRHLRVFAATASGLFLRAGFNSCRLDIEKQRYHNGPFLIAKRFVYCYSALVGLLNKGLEYVVSSGRGVPQA